MSYSLILLIASPLATLIQSFPRLASAYDCSRRIQRYLIADDKRTMTLQASEKPSSNQESDEKEGHSCSPDNTPRSTLSDEYIVSIRDADIGWDSEKSPILSDITLNIRRSRLTLITGPVASGKSTLLKGFLGENMCLKGAVRVSSHRVGFCDQVPWLTNATIRENIVGVSDFKDNWYKMVIHTCVLDEIWKFPNGDQTLLGSDGVTLSGGQKHRIVN